MEEFHTVKKTGVIAYPDKSPPGRFPTVQVLVLMSGIYWFVVVLVGSCPPRDSGPGGDPGELS